MDYVTLECALPGSYRPIFRRICQDLEYYRKHHPKVSAAIPIRLGGGRFAYLWTPPTFSAADADHVCQWVRLQIDPDESVKAHDAETPPS